MFIVRYDVISERGCPCHEGSTQLGPRSIPFDDYSDAVAYATNLNTTKPFANGPDAVDLVAANIDIFTQQLVLIPHEDWNPVVKSVADDLEKERIESAELKEDCVYTVSCQHIYENTKHCESKQEFPSLSAAKSCYHSLQDDASCISLCLVKHGYIISDIKVFCGTRDVTDLIRPLKIKYKVTFNVINSFNKMPLFYPNRLVRTFDDYNAAVAFMDGLLECESVESYSNPKLIIAARLTKIKYSDNCEYGFEVIVNKHTK